MFIGLKPVNIASWMKRTKLKGWIKRDICVHKVNTYGNMHMYLLWLCLKGQPLLWILQYLSSLSRECPLLTMWFYCSAFASSTYISGNSLKKILKSFSACWERWWGEGQLSSSFKRVSQNRFFISRTDKPLMKSCHHTFGHNIELRVVVQKHSSYRFSEAIFFKIKERSPSAGRRAVWRACHSK